MRTEKEIREQLIIAYSELQIIEQSEYFKSLKSDGRWRMAKRYIDGLQFALGED